MKSPIAALAVLALLHTLATLVLAVAGPVDTHVPPSDIELKRFTAYSFAAYSNIELSRPFGCKPCQHPLVNGTELVYTWAKDIPSIHGYIGVNHALKTIVAVRVNQFRDIAARIPPSLMGFQHIDREIWIKPGSGEIKYCKAFGGAQGGSGEDPDCINSVPFNQLTPNDHPVYFGIGSDFDF
ncbi:hypothetical protein GQ42DRAFT_155303 [Ramicandelaber brevisporus]|nr:hypothetical protein GQ42DRAFT_155303 [Ramicandelaber brevisporus]